MKKIFTNSYVMSFLMLFFLVLGGTHLKAQNQETIPEGFTFLKTIDQVEIYYKQVYCDDNVEYIVIGAINISGSEITLDLQPVFLADDHTFNSQDKVNFTLSEGEQILGDCNTSNMQVSIFEFFSQFDSTLISFDLTKI